MTTTLLSLYRQGRSGLYLLVGLLLAGGPIVAQTPDGLPLMPQPDLQRPPLVPADTLLLPNSPGSPSSASQPNRIRLFRIQPGFLSDPVGLDSDDNTPMGPSQTPQTDSDPDWITIAFGNDNPFFDFRRSNDPGGVGFTRINTQVQLFDTNRTACSLGLQAVTPSGQQCDGLSDKMGTTAVTPALSLFHTLDDDATAVQAYIGKHMAPLNTRAQQINPDLQCGLAVQRPLTTDGNDLLRGVYVSVGALGQVRLSDASTSAASATARQPVAVEVLPGLTYKMADNWWISGGLVLPVGTRSDAMPGQQWQVTCSLQF